jgi:hypothetical protein
MDRPYGWVFFYQAKRSIETRNPLDGFGGNAPIIIAEYEATLPAAQLSATPEPSKRAGTESP